MKKIILFILMFCLLINFPVSANDFIFNQEGGDNITIVSDKGTIKGKTEEKFVVNLNGEERIITENGRFSFTNLEPDIYKLKIYNQNETLIYEKEIIIENNETVNLGTINDKKANNNLEEQSYIDFEKANQKEENSNFLIESLSFENQFSIMNIDYRNNLSVGDGYRTTYSSSGYLNEIQTKLPIKMDKINIELGIDYGVFSSDSDTEREYNNNSLNEVYMVDLEGNYVNLKGSVFYDISGIGRIKGFLGMNYYKNTFDKTNFENGTGNRAKIDYDGDGFIYGISFDTYIGEYLNSKENNFLSNVLLGFGYSRSESDIKVSNTFNFDNFNTSGYKNTLDFYIGYRKNFDLKLGYKMIDYYVSEYNDLNYYYPDLELEMSGLYISLGMNF